MPSVDRPPAPKHDWCLDDFVIGRRLGRGKFGKVYLAVDKDNFLPVAIKVIQKKKLRDTNLEHQLRREVEIMSNLRHPNILRLYTVFTDRKAVYLVLELCPGGEVFSKLRDQERFSEKQTAIYIHDLAHALHYCHQKSVIHRDIKPENLLLDGEGKIKLSDFGWSVHSPSTSAPRHTMCGTMDYLPPEMVDHKNHAQTADVWSLGVLTYEFVTGSPPFESRDGQADTFKKIKFQQIKVPSYVSTECADFIRGLLKKTPTDRFGLDQVPRHPFIQKYVQPAGGMRTPHQQYRRHRDSRGVSRGM